MFLFVMMGFVAQLITISFVGEKTNILSSEIFMFKQISIHLKYPETKLIESLHM